VGILLGLKIWRPRGRSSADLKALGFDDLIWQRITEDWRASFAPSSYVLVSEHKTPKNAENLIAMDSYSPLTKAFRALHALRLCGTGSIGIGPMWMARPADFNVGLSGLSQSGFSIPAMGSSYHWTDDIAKN
jgi:hypothetical protein